MVMDRDRINEIRKSLKWNFLKTTILRLDITNIADSNVVVASNLLKNFLQQNGFNRCVEKTNNDVEVNLPTQGYEFKTELKDKYKVLCYTNDEKGISLELSKKAILIVVNSSSYVPFESITNIYLQVANVFKSAEPYIVFKRIGIRKINILLVNNLDYVKELINPSTVFFSNIDSNSTPLISSLTDQVVSGDKKITKTRKLENGKIGEAEWFRCSLDFDVSADEQVLKDHPEIALAREKTYEMNAIIFECYISSLSNSFISELIKDDYSNDRIIGVEPNE